MADQPMICIFGRVTCTVDGQPVAVPVGKPSVVLVVLAFEAGRTVRIDRIVDALWDADPPASARALVHTYISALRRALTAGGPVITTVPNGYRLECLPEDVDLHRFLAATAGVGEPSTWQECLDASSEPLLGAEDQPFAEPWRERVESGRRRLQERLWAWRIDQGDGASVVPDLRAAVVEEPVAEEPALHLARALGESAHAEEGIVVLDRLRERVGVELGLDVSPRVEELRRRLVEERTPALAPARPPSSQIVPVPGDTPSVAHDIARPHRSRAERRVRGWGIAAIAAVAVGLTSAVAWSSLTGTGPTAPGAAPTSRALLVLEAGSGAMTDVVRLSVSPTELAVAGDRIWIRSESDRAVSMVDLTNVDAARTAGLSEPPTSLAAHSDVAYVALGFTGDIATVADGSVQPPASAGDDVDGRLTLAADEAGAWVATIDGHIRPPAGAIASPPGDVEGLPVRLAVDRGDAWVLTRTPDALVRISDGERAISSQLRGRPVDLAVRNGVAWVVTAGDDRLWGTSPEGGRVATTAVLPGSPTAVEIVGDIVWVALADPAAMIGVDARTLERRHFIPLAGVPSDVAVVGDHIVVALR